MQGIEFISMRKGIEMQTELAAAVHFSA